MVVKKLVPTTRGARFRDRVSEQLDLSAADEIWLALLDETSAAMDLIERLADEVDGHMMVAGSQGQPVANPLLPELRQQRAALARMLTQLGISDEPESAGTRAARKAARARWARA